MNYAFVEVTKRGDPPQILYFLVPAERGEAVAEMRRLIVAGGTLKAIHGEDVNAVELNTDLVEERGPGRADSSIPGGGGATFAVDGSLVRLPDESTEA